MRKPTSTKVPIRMLLFGISRDGRETVKVAQSQLVASLHLTQKQVDGFRFDLMGHIMKSTMPNGYDNGTQANIEAMLAAAKDHIQYEQLDAAGIELPSLYKWIER